MKIVIALALFVALAYAAEEVPTVAADGSADLAVDEHKWRGYYGGHRGYGYGRPHYYGGYGYYGRKRRSADEDVPVVAVETPDQTADAHRYGGYYGGGYGYGGYGGYGGYYRPHYYGGYYGRPYWG